VTGYANNYLSYIGVSNELTPRLFPKGENTRKITIEVFKAQSPGFEVDDMEQPLH